MDMATSKRLMKLKGRIKPLNLEVISESDVDTIYTAFTEVGNQGFIKNTLDEIKNEILDKKLKKKEGENKNSIQRHETEE